VVKIFLSLNILLFSFSEIFSQEMQFERKINPFDFNKKNGSPYELPFVGGFNVPRIQFIDIDIDGDKDLFVQEIDNQLIFFENSGSAQDAIFKWQTDDWLQKNHGAWFRFVDIDNDGDHDLFSQGNQEQVRFFVAENDQLNVKQDALRSINGEPIISELTSIPDFYDIDCDGDKDLFLGRQQGTITFYENIDSPIDQTPQFKFITDTLQGIRVVGGGLV
jgi:hypothetical protein